MAVISIIYNLEEDIGAIEISLNGSIDDNNCGVYRVGYFRVSKHYNLEEKDTYSMYNSGLSTREKDSILKEKKNIYAKLLEAVQKKAQSNSCSVIAASDAVNFEYAHLSGSYSSITRGNGLSLGEFAETTGWSVSARFPNPRHSGRTETVLFHIAVEYPEEAPTQEVLAQPEPPQEYKAEYYRPPVPPEPEEGHQAWVRARMREAKVRKVRKERPVMPWYVENYFAQQKTT